MLSKAIQAAESGIHTFYNARYRSLVPSRDWEGVRSMNEWMSGPYGISSMCEHNLGSCQHLPSRNPLNTDIIFFYGIQKVPTPQCVPLPTRGVLSSSTLSPEEGTELVRRKEWGAMSPPRLLVLTQASRSLLSVGS